MDNLNLVVAGDIEQAAVCDVFRDGVGGCCDRQYFGVGRVFQLTNQRVCCELPATTIKCAVGQQL